MEEEEEDIPFGKLVFNGAATSPSLPPSLRRDTGLLWVLAIKALHGRRKAKFREEGGVAATERKGRGALISFPGKKSIQVRPPSLQTS